MTREAVDVDGGGVPVPHTYTRIRAPVCVSRIHPGLSAVKLSDLPRIFHGTPFVSSRSSRGTGLICAYAVMGWMQSRGMT